MGALKAAAIPAPCHEACARVLGSAAPAAPACCLRLRTPAPSVLKPSDAPNQSGWRTGRIADRPAPSRIRSAACRPPSPGECRCPPPRVQSRSGLRRQPRRRMWDTEPSTRSSHGRMAVGAIDQQRFEPHDAQVEGHRRQAADSAARMVTTSSRLPLRGHAAQEPGKDSCIKSCRPARNWAPAFPRSPKASHSQYRSRVNHRSDRKSTPAYGLGSVAFINSAR